MWVTYSRACLLPLCVSLTDATVDNFRDPHFELKTPHATRQCHAGDRGQARLIASRHKQRVRGLAASQACPLRPRASAMSSSVHQERYLVRFLPSCIRPEVASSTKTSLSCRLDTLQSRRGSRHVARWAFGRESCADAAAETDNSTCDWVIGNTASVCAINRRHQWYGMYASARSRLSALRYFPHSSIWGTPVSLGQKRPGPC
jgi:hypothetical protein